MSDHESHRPSSVLGVVPHSSTRVEAVHTQVSRWGIGLLSRETGLVFLGRVGGAGFGFLMSWAVARWMGPEMFGLYSLFIVILILGNDVLGDGLNPGVVRDYALHSEHSALRGAEVLSTALILRMVLGTPVAVVGTVVALSASSWSSQNEAYVAPLALGLIGSFGAALLSFTLATWQARQAFVSYALTAAAVNTLRLASAVILFAFSSFTLALVMGLHVVFYYLCAGFALWRLWPTLAGLRFDPELLRALLRFSKWPALASLCFVLQSNLAVPVLMYTANAAEAGIYAAGASLLMLIDFLTVSLLTTLLPRVSQLRTPDQWRAYVKRFFPLFLTMALSLFPLVFAARPLVEWLYGSAYTGTIVVVQILFLGGIGTLLSHPLYLVLYAMNRPHLFSLTQALALIGWILMGWWLIPHYGAVGAAWTTLLARLFQSVAIIGVVIHVLDLRRIRSTSSGLVGEEAHTR